MILYTLCDSGTSADNNPVYFTSGKDENNSRMVYNDRMVEKTQVSDFEPSDFGFVSDFGFRASDFNPQKIKGPNMNGYFGTTSPAQGISHTTAGTYLDTYYIYSFDGKLLAEYDQNGLCVSDYIYAGNRLIAEYRPQTNEHYFYMNDQVNSTRVVTDEDGIEVYSAFYSPYGDIHESGTNAVDPKLKFSGKERESYAELDYFGARYYDHNRYRFLSVDPVINKEEALSNPQLWNLYAYCRNNPITFMDPDGRIESHYLTGSWRQKLYERWHQEGGRDYADSKMMQMQAGDFGGALGGAAFLSAYFAPEIAAALALSPAIKNAGDKISNLLNKFKNRLGRFFEADKPTSGQIKAFERQLSEFGKDSLLKSRNRFVNLINEHIQKLKDIKSQGGYISSIEKELSNFKRQIKAIDEVLRRK